AEDAGVLGLVLLEDVGLHGAAHGLERVGLDARVGVGVQQLVAGDAQQAQAQAVVPLGQAAAVLRALAAFKQFLDLVVGGVPAGLVDAHRSKPEYSFFMSSSVGMLTPELPILP